jgi:tetratricopeptide (TPR) repeat protein
VRLAVRNWALESRPGAGVALLALWLLCVPSAGPAQGLLGDLQRGMKSQALSRQARTLYDAGDYTSARTRLLEAVALEPTHDEARALLGWAHYHLGEYRAAAIAFKAALRRQPSWDGLYDGLGWSRLRLGRYHLAIEAFQSALDLSPDHGDALIGLGTALFELERYEAAVQPLERALRGMATISGREARDAPGARARLAWSLYYVGRLPEAIDAFQGALRATPNGAGLHNGLGWCLLRLGDRRQARAAFERALALQPGYEDALEGLRQARS